ncbi:MAG: glutamine-hydrolyzing GMP synthase [bacterium]|nr:glutamine-hydrolyzing GMP synthase [bacterium]
MLYTFKGATEQALREVDEEKAIRKTGEIFLLFTLGSQFDHLIKLALDRLGVFCLVCDPASVTAEDVKQLNPKGIIISGGPVSVYEEPPPFDGKIFDLGIPVLGICLGFQLWAQHIGAQVRRGEKREFGTHSFSRMDSLCGASVRLFANCPKKMPVLESHGDVISNLGGITVLGETENAPVAAGRFQHLWGVQFHPEVTETMSGLQIFENFCFSICGAEDRFPAGSVAESKVGELREQVGDQKVLLALSGGSDSSTVAYLLKRALQGQKKQLHAVYIKGIDRPDDEACVMKYFGDQDWLTLEVVDATGQFLAALDGVANMRDKRLAMRLVYRRVLQAAAVRSGANFIAQGTLYTDISESGGGYASGAKKAQIKLHHNVNLGFTLPELTPLADCVKDTGRNIGRAVGVPEELLIRHPFPGPGLIVRIEGVVSETNLAIARQADSIFIEELRKWELYESIWQAGAVVTDSVATCTKGDDAVSGRVVALWAVWSVNGFTARWARLPYDFLDLVSRRITNEIRGVGGVVYRVSSKPPTTIEWG